MQEQAPISEADPHALAARNCEGTEQLRELWLTIKYICENVYVKIVYEKM